MPHPRRALVLFAVLSSQLMVSVGAGLTTLFGPLPTWAAVLLVIGLLGVFGWLMSGGQRKVPIWLLGSVFALLLGTAFTMEYDERLAPIGLALGLLTVHLVRRRLRVLSAPQPQFRGGTASPDISGEAGSPLPQVGKPSTGWVEPPLPTLDPSRREVATSTTINLTPSSMRWVILGVGTGTTLLGVFCLWALYIDDQEMETASRVLGTFFGLMFLAFGAFILLSGLTVGRRQTLTVDAHGIRRTGTGPRWDLEWPDVTAVGLRVQERTRDPMTSGTGINRRRTVTLLLALTEPASPHAPAEGPSLRPFTHQDALPDLHPSQVYSPTVIELDQAFRRLVPDLYVGVLQD